MTYFIKKYSAIVITVTTLLLVGCDSSNDIETSAQAKQWSVKIIAESIDDNLRFDNNRLGQVSVATNDIDRYDLKSIPRPFEGPFLSVNFPQNGKGYITNFHSTEMSKSDEWIFTVNSNADSTVVLRWDMFALISYTDNTGRIRFDQKLNIDENLVKKMQLVDAETNTTLVSAYANGKLQSYTFNMNDATTRTFKWKLNDENVVEKVQEASAKYEPLYKAASMRANALEIDKQIDITIPPRTMGK